MCERLGETTLATVVDHIQPHRGDDKLFWDSTNWMALCADHHSGAKQSMEKRETTTTATTKVKAVLLCGPPGSGKREYIQRMRKSGDLVVDMDALFQALSGEPLYSQPAELLPYVAEARDAVVMRLARATAPVTAWLIGAGATRDARERIARPLAARVLVLATPPQACARRIMRDRDRSHLIAKVQPLIDRWWQDYEPSDGDTVIDALH
jgi:predicted kinase